MQDERAADGDANQQQPHKQAFSNHGRWVILESDARANCARQKEAAMPRFCANLTMMFNEVPFLDRFDAAAKAGFQAVEFLFPYDYKPADIRARLDANG